MDIKLNDKLMLYTYIHNCIGWKVCERLKWNRNAMKRVLDGLEDGCCWIKLESERLPAMIIHCLLDDHNSNHAIMAFHCCLSPFQ